MLYITNIYVCKEQLITKEAKNKQKKQRKYDLFLFLCLFLLLKIIKITLLSSKTIDRVYAKSTNELRKTKSLGVRKICLR